MCNLCDIDVKNCVDYEFDSFAKNYIGRLKFGFDFIRVNQMLIESGINTKPSTYVNFQKFSILYLVFLANYTYRIRSVV